MSEASSLASDATIFVNDGGALKQTPVAVLSGAMTGSDAAALHFKGVLSELPDNPAEYSDGDVILVGEKEYVFYGSTFFELGDASGIAANASAIAGLDKRVLAMEEADHTLEPLTVTYMNSEGNNIEAAYDGTEEVSISLGAYATKADVTSEITGTVNDAVAGMVRSVNGTEPDASGDVTLSITGTVKSVNGVSPDENGNVTIALTEGGEGTGIASIVQTTTSTADGGTNVITVTLTNGTTSAFEVRNGTQGSPGDPGDPGYSPVRGTDYWTDEDKQGIIDDVLAALPTAEGVAF